MSSWGLSFIKLVSAFVALGIQLSSTPPTPRGSSPTPATPSLSMEDKPKHKKKAKSANAPPKASPPKQTLEEVALDVSIVGLLKDAPLVQNVDKGSTTEAELEKIFLGSFGERPGAEKQRGLCGVIKPIPAEVLRLGGATSSSGNEGVRYFVIPC